MLTTTTTRMGQDAVGPMAGRVQMRYTVRVTAHGGKDQVIHRDQVAEAAIAAVPEADRTTMDVWTNISWEEDRVWRVDVHTQVKDSRARASRP